MPNIPSMYDGVEATDSTAGGGTPPATPAAGTPTAPARDLDQTTSTAPATAPQIAPEDAGGTLTPAERSLKADSWGTKLYHGVLDALGGGGDVAYTRDPTTGKLTAKPVATGPGTQWKKIIAGGLAGFASAAQAGSTGPGATMRMAGAGAAGGMNFAQQQNDRARSNANQDFDAGQKAATADAQRSLLSHQIAASTFDLGRAQVTAGVQDSERESNFEQVITDGGQGSADMGVFPDFQSVMKAFKETPELHDHQAGGRILTIPHINGKGQVDGVRAALVTPDWLHSKIDRELPITTRTFENGKTKENTFTIPAGSLTGEQYANMVQAQSKDALEEFHKTQAADLAKQKQGDEEKLHASEEAKNYSSATHDKAESRALNEAADINTVNANAAQLVEGRMDIANLSKRSKTYDATLAAANAYSLNKYNVPFDPAKAAGDYKFATNKGTYDTLNYLDSLVGRDNASGNLGEVIRLSNGLKRTDYPPLNATEQWAKVAAGDPQVVAYRGALTEVSDQIAKVLQGGTGSATSDKKLEQAQDLLNKNFNASQIRSVATELRELLANRKRGIMGTNRYLLQWYGVPQNQGSQPQPGQGAQPIAKPAGATGTVKGSDGKTYWTNDKRENLGVAQ